MALSCVHWAMRLPIRLSKMFWVRSQYFLNEAGNSNSSRRMVFGEFRNPICTLKLLDSRATEHSALAH